MADNTRSPIGVILLNLGGPDSLQAIRPFLYNLFSDRQIIRLGPAFMQKPIASFISATRAGKTKDMYRKIGGRSPILDITLAQAKALEQALNEGACSLTSGPFGARAFFKVYAGMRYWHPFIDDVIGRMHGDGITGLIALSLYPHYSLATTGSSLSELKKAIIKVYRPCNAEAEKLDTAFANNSMRDKSSFAARAAQLAVCCISSWFDHPQYIAALVDVIKKGLPSVDTPVLFSAHSLPEKFINEGDPYVGQITATIKEIAKRININWHLSYQSKSGPVKWIEPSTGDKIKELADRGAREILVVPISFVSDHIETLYEIDILYKQMAEELGVKLRRTESLNTHPLFIAAMKDMIMTHAKELDWGG